MAELTMFLMCRAKEKDWKEKEGNTWVEGYYAKRVDENGAEHHVFLQEEGHSYMHHLLTAHRPSILDFM